MDRFREIAGRIIALFHRQRADRDFDDELSAHVEMAVAEAVENGVSPVQARREALARLGGLDRTREIHRDARGVPVLESLGRDLRDATRLLRRSPAFTSVAILSLALGIGANTAIFSILNALVLRPLPVHEPDRLVQLMSGPERSSWTYPLWNEIRSRSELVQGTAAWGAVSQVSFGMIERGELEPLNALSVSGSFFEVFGVRPARGRLISTADDVAGGPPGGPVAVISDAFWKRRFGASEDVIGQVLTLNRFPVTIVGITPPGFFGPMVGESFDLMMPMCLLPRPLLDARGFWWVFITARMKPGQTAEDVTREFFAVQAEMRAATLPTDVRPEQVQAYLSEPIFATPAAQGVSGLRTRYQWPLVVIMAAVGLVLLIACANIANLLLARADARRHELSIRLALGASRGRLMRQLFVESLMLAAGGALAGMVVASWGGRLLVHQLSTTLPLPLDWRVLAFTATATLVTALLFGVGPAYRATRVAPGAALAGNGRTIAGSRTRGGLGQTLVVVQVALSLVLVVGSGLLVRTFGALVSTDLGFTPDGVLTVMLTRRPGAPPPPPPEYGSRLDRILEAVRQAPGVASAAFSGGTTPMSGYQHDNFIENPEGLSLPESERDVFFRDAGSDWFRTLGIPFVAGRDFGREDIANHEQVAVVNETFARKFFPDRTPIGRTVREVSGPSQPTPTMTIVGVVADAVYNSAREGVPPTLYHFLPNVQTMVVRARNGDATSVRLDVTAAVRRIDPDFITSHRVLSDQVTATVARERLVAMLSGFFGLLALLIAGVGVYGVMAYAVGRRRSEIAVRRALGATAGHIMWLVVGRSLWLVALGVAAGTLASVWIMGLLQPLLYGLGPRDPATIASAALVLGLVGLLAGWIPALRAARVDPAAVLKDG